MRNRNEARRVAEGHEQRQADISTNTYEHTFNANGGRFILYWSGCTIPHIAWAGMHPGVGDLVLCRHFLRYVAGSSVSCTIKVKQASKN